MVILTAREIELHRDYNIISNYFLYTHFTVVILSKNSVKILTKPLKNANNFWYFISLSLIKYQNNVRFNLNFKF